MKVCFLAPELLPNRGGVGSYSVGLLRELSRQIEVVVVSPQRWEGQESYGAREIEAYFDQRLRAHVISESRDSFVYNARFQIALLRRFPRLEREEHFDVVHSHHAHMPDLLSGAVNHVPPTVRTVHTTIAGQLEGIHAADRLGGRPDTPDRWQIVLAPLLAAAERSIFLRRRDRYLAVSGWMRDQLQGRGIPPDRIGVAYCGVDPSIFRPDLRAPELLRRSPDERIVLFPSRLTMIRGSAVLAQAMPQILAAVPEARFVITGQKQADAQQVLPLPAGLEDRVRFLGHQPYDRLPAIYASSDVVVVPTFYDNFPIRILESFASGVPVVATPVGGIPEVVQPGRTGIIVPVGSASALADGVVRLLRDEEFRRHLGEEARALVTDRFTWRHSAERTLEAYRAAAEGSSPGLRR